jgi:outer membrane lipoprotein-sorting protein
MNNKMIKFATAATIIVAALTGLHYLGGSSGAVYADVVKQLQKARTLVYTAISTTPIEGMPDMEMEVAFKEPGYMRMTLPDGYVSVFDGVEGKGISIIPTRKQFIEIDMSNLPEEAGQREFNIIEQLRTLPERADENLGEQLMDGQTVHGFRVNESDLIYTVWIDPKSRELVLVEVEFDNAPGMNGTMSDFQFDVELEDSLFSLAPPEGYTKLELQVDASDAGEKDLIELFRLWSTWTKDGTFPPTLNPVELAKISMEMAKSGKFGGDATAEQPQYQDVMLMTRALMFVTSLPAESNWRYAGENVKHGDADTPIFWYQPEGSKTYRVIYGDLNVKDVSPSNLPQ